MYMFKTGETSDNIFVVKLKVLCDAGIIISINNIYKIISVEAIQLFLRVKKQQ